MTETPKVSLLVPVYNAGEHLRRFIESVIQQSFQDYELICVENWSTDNTLEILNEYQQAFPDKIFVYRTEEHSGVGRGRNIAFKHSRGEYVFWCDSDDIVSPYGIERLYNEAVNTNSDMVIGEGIYVYQNEKGDTLYTRRTSSKKTQSISNEAAILSGNELWLRLVKRSLAEKAGPLREDVTFDDVSYVPILHSYAEKIRHVNIVVYYYFRRSNYSTCTKLSPKVSLDSVEAERHALMNCNPQYLYAVEKMVADRIVGNFCIRWQFIDIYIKWANELMPRFAENELVLKDVRTLRAMMGMTRHIYETIPNNIYVPGFVSAPLENRLTQLEENVFHDGADIFVLSPQTCNISENAYIKEAFDNGRYDLVEGYFALKNIYEHGGVYIHPCINIINFFNIYKYYNTFFSLIDRVTYSDRIFGGIEGSPVIKDILDTFSFDKDKRRRFPSISERIMSVLTINYDIPLDGKDRPFGEVVSIISPEFGAVDTRFGNTNKRICFEHDFSEYSGNDEYITMKRETFKEIVNSVSASVFSRGGTANSSRAPATNSAYVNAYHELQDMKQTNTYKLMMKIRRLGDSRLGPFLKKIFHGMLKLRAKFKKQ